MLRLEEVNAIVDKEASYGVSIIDNVRTMNTEGMTDERKVECLAYWEATQNRNTLIYDILNYKP